MISPDSSRSGDVITIDQRHALLNSAFTQGNFHFGRDVDKSTAGGEIEPKFLAAGFHKLLTFSICVTLMIVLESHTLR